VAIFSWDGVLAKGRAAPDVLDGFAQSLKRFDTACIIHTSGTGGAPKGVMLSHGAILHNCSGARKLLLELGLADEVFLSFLPLSHSYEHTAGMFFPLSIGAQIYYADGADQLGAFMVETRPTIMTAVPRLYEMMRGRILRGLAREKGLKVKLFHRAVELGTKKILNPNSLTFSEKMENLLLDLLVRSKVKARFGGRLKAMVSGGAPLNPEVGLFFSSLGVPVLQGYGQTESAPVISCNPPSRPKMHTVGPVLEEVTVKIAEDGEILVQGELVMQGYWNDSEADTQVLKDGWLHTGDIGEFDEDGYLRITDRKKDIIVNSGGDNVAPQRVEGLLTLEPEIGQAMVHGDKRPHLVALIVPDGEFAQSWAKERGLPLDLAALAEMAEFRKAIGTAIERVNTGLSNIEKVRRFTLLPAPFSVDNGMMTPTLKVRRHKIREAYGEMLEGMYG
jgi:long-chain acyl-CoA synthetase